MTAICYSTTVTSFHGEVALPYWQTLARVAEQEGITRENIEAILRRSAEHCSSISVKQYIDLMKLGVECCDDFGLRAGCAVTPGSYPVLGMTLLSCQSLKQVLEQVVRYESLNHDLGASSLEVGEKESYYRWTPSALYFPDQASVVSFHVVVSVFAGIRTFAPWLINQDIPVKRINFMAPEPKNARLLKTFFDSEIQYNQPDNSVVVNTDVLDWPVSNGDVASFDVLTSHADTLLNTRMNKRDIVWQLKSILSEALRKQTYRIEDVAGQLNMSTRTLQRKLKECGCNYQQVLDEVRKQLAEFYLAEADISMSEIAFLVGYLEQSSFNHAFKNWSGLSPTAYREQRRSLTP